MPVVLCALALVDTNYFGWALMGCLGLDLLLRFGGNGRLAAVAGDRDIPATGGGSDHAGVGHGTAYGAVTCRASLPVATGIYNLYCLFVSESVAPWFWVPGITAGLAIAGVLLLVFFTARRLAAILAVLCRAADGDDFFADRIHQADDDDRSWLILSIGTTLATAARPSARRLLAARCFDGRDRLVRHFLTQTLRRAALDRTWDEVARQAAEVTGNGGIVIGNNPTFFFY